MANFSHSYKEDCFAVFEYCGAVQIISYTNVDVSFFVFFIFQTKLERAVLFE